MNFYIWPIEHVYVIVTVAVVDPLDPETDAEFGLMDSLADNNVPTLHCRFVVQ